MNLQESTFSSSRSATFTSKVLSLFGLALLVSGIGVYAGIHYGAQYFYTAPATMLICFAVELGLIFTSRLWSKIEPLNYFLFTAFTFISGVTIVPLILSFAAEFKGFGLIYSALFATTATFGAAGLFGYTTKRSLAGLSGFLFMSLIGLLVVGIGGIFFPWGNNMEMLVSGFGVLIFAGYAAVDINRLKEYPEDEYIQAAMHLYLDFFNLFIYILRLTGAVSRN